MQNNRHLKDTRMDDLDHALGRPNDPTERTNRNFFGVSIGDADATKMKNDPYWRHTRDFLGTSGFAVSDEGKIALKAYLKDNWSSPIPQKHYNVTFGGYTSTVPAKTASAAKYLAWFRADFTDLPFGEYIKSAHARVA